MKKKTDKKLVFVILLAILWTLGPFIIIFIGIMLDDYKKNFKMESNGNVIVEKDEVLIKNNIKNYYNEEEKAYYIEGYLVNLMNNKLDSVLIEYTLYDVENNVIGTASASINNLEGKETWKFKAAYSEIDANKAVKIKFSSISY